LTNASILLAGISLIKTHAEREKGREEKKSGWSKFKWDRTGRLARDMNEPRIKGGRDFNNTIRSHHLKIRKAR
jgi:hypothetical protein